MWILRRPRDETAGVVESSVAERFQALPQIAPAVARERLQRFRRHGDGDQSAVGFEERSEDEFADGIVLQHGKLVTLRGGENLLALENQRLAAGKPHDVALAETRRRRRRQGAERRKRKEADCAGAEQRPGGPKRWVSRGKRAWHQRFKPALVLRGASAGWGSR